MIASMGAHWRVIVAHIVIWIGACLTSFFFILTAYLAFYHFYIPAERISMPVYFDYQYQNFPEYTVSLPSSQIFHSIHYDVSLKMLIPDIAGLSESLGNVMVQTTVQQKQQQSPNRIIATSTRPTLLIYRSWPARLTILCLRLWPVVFGLAREATMHRVFLMERFQLKRPASIFGNNSTTFEFVISISDKRLPVYEAELEIIAHFDKLRYLMYYWKWSFGALIVGLSTLGMVIFISLITLLSMYFHFRNSTEQQEEAEETDLSSSEHSVITNPSQVDQSKESLKKASIRRRKKKFTELIVPDTLPSFPLSESEIDIASSDPPDPLLNNGFENLHED